MNNILKIGSLHSLANVKKYHNSIYIKFPSDIGFPVIVTLVTLRLQHSHVIVITYCPLRHLQPLVTLLLNKLRHTHNKKYHSGIRGIYITNTSTTMVFANEKTRSTTITVPRLLLPFP